MNYLRVNPKLFEITRLGDNKNLSRFVSEIVGKKTEMAEGVGDSVCCGTVKEKRLDF